MDTLKRKRLFYSENDDLVLLREISGYNPYEDPSRWTIIEKNVREATCKDFSKRSMQDRAKILLEKFQKKADEDLFKSGTEEPVTEMDDLLNNILSLLKEFKKGKVKSKPYHIGLERRDAAVEQIEQDIIGQGVENESNGSFGVQDDEVQEEISILFTDEESTSHNKEGTNPEAQEEQENVEPLQVSFQGREGTTRGRGRGRGRGNRTRIPSRGRCSLKYASIKFLEMKNERWYEIRRKELEMEKQKFLLEKKEREHNMELAEKRFKLEEKKVEGELHFVRAQQKIMDNQQRLLEIAFNART